MNVIVCLDERNGMLFGKKRQSKDRFVIDDINQDRKDTTLWIHPFSQSLFSESDNVKISEQFLDEGNDGLCFVENQALLPYADTIDKIIIYRWNRHYPSTTTFDLPLSNYHLESKCDFKGYSHDNITKEIYITWND